MAKEGGDEGSKAKRGAAGLGMGLGGVLFFYGIFQLVPSCLGMREPVLRTVAACPLAVRALGGGAVTQSYLGFSYGNAETEGDHGSASWTFAAQAGRRGTVDFWARKSGGEWQLYRVLVHAGGQDIDAQLCAPLGQLPGGAGRRGAEVSSVLGNTALTQGQRCELDLRPGDGPWGCRAQVRCGAQVLYGATASTGFLRCAAGRAGGVTAHDEGSTPVNGDPTLELDTAAGTLVLTDQGRGGTWAVSLRLDPLAAP